MAIGVATLTDAGLALLQEAHSQGGTVYPAFFKFSDTLYQDGEGNIDPSTTDISGWYLRI